MACPFFVPAGRLDAGSPTSETHVPRLPLGDAYRGVCHAQPEGFEPPDLTQRDVCNWGYARGRCECFPGTSGADAVRFSITGDRDGQIRLVYILEKDYSPVEHGLVDYTLNAARTPLTANEPLREPLALQAAAFLQSYLRRSLNPPE